MLIAAPGLSRKYWQFIEYCDQQLTLKTSEKQRRFNTNVCLPSRSGRQLVNVKNLTCVAYEAALPAGQTTDKQPLPEDSGRVKSFGKLIELISHRRPVSNILLCGSPAPKTAEVVTKTMPSTTSIPVCYVGEQEGEISQEIKARVNLKPLQPALEDLIHSEDETSDIVPLDECVSISEISVATLLPLVQEQGWLLGSSRQHVPPQSSLQLGEQFALLKTTTYTNGISPQNEDITLLILSEVDYCHDLKSMMPPYILNRKIHEKSIEQFSRTTIYLS
ncbi:hypothetical protein BTUL_0140g00020 [Botrytis tulipae]|uniref:Uncharacterized protein n=1 Tax=Botrytis tulipae TaxID=87230 RepID=A0A4Z1ED79_9HELO|nr:hypothetical protein BTUL_0140g00020 [Botrytis tulipae]